MKVDFKISKTDFRIRINKTKRYVELYYCSGDTCYYLDEIKIPKIMKNKDTISTEDDFYITYKD